MPKSFNELRERLLRAGVAPRNVRRYLAEINDHFADLRAEEQRAGLSGDEADSAALLRLGTMDSLAQAMIDQHQFQSWSVRAPWAVFGLAPVCALAAAWFLSLFILWAGWQMFLPGADTPFGARLGPHSIFELSNIYFQMDKMFYFFAPILVGWGFAVIAARQRLSAAWPIAGLVPIAVIGVSEQVHAGRTAVPNGWGHISMNLALGSSIQDLLSSLLFALLFFSVMALPYLIWRFQKTFFASS